MDQKKCRTKPRSRKLGFFNAIGIHNQRDEISTFPRAISLISSLKIAHYRLFRKNRDRYHKGGTLIYYKRTLYCIPMDPALYLVLIVVSICRLGMTSHQPCRRTSLPPLQRTKTSLAMTFQPSLTSVAPPP